MLSRKLTIGLRKNFLINSHKANFCEMQKLNARFSAHNLKYLNDLTMIHNNMEQIAMRDWKLEQNTRGKKSLITREFSFNDHNEALIFMNIAKEKAQQLCHHPEWELSRQSGKSVLSVVYSTHDAGNTVTAKDYELACILSYEYEDRNYSKYNRQYQTMVSSGFSVAVAFAFVWVIYHFYTREKNYIKGSRDFYCSKINY